MRIGAGVPRDSGQGSGPTFVIQALTTETWLAMLADGRQGERLVTRWAWDAPARTLTLTLRKDVYFHDGTQLTPELAVEALRATTKKTVGAVNLKAITPHDDGTVTIELAEPNAFLLPDLALASVVLPANPKVGTGPFQIASESDSQYILKAFPKYYRGAPGLSAIEVNVYPTQRNAWAALMRGEVDMLHEVSRDAAEFVDAETTVNTYSFLRPYYIPVVFNTRHPILKRADVRIAINEALDRAAIVRDGLRGRGTAAEGPIWPQHWAYPGTGQAFTFDPRRAKARLDAAGFPVKPDVDGTPRRFSFSCLMFANDSRFDRVAAAVQKQLADVGIDMRIIPLPQDALEKRIGKGDFDAFIFEFAGRSLSWTYRFWRTGQGLMSTGYTSGDAILDRMRTARSDDEVKAAAVELARTFREDPPAAFLAWQETSRAVSTSFDVAAEQDRDIFTSIWQWQRAKQPRKLTSK